MALSSGPILAEGGVDAACSEGLDDGADRCSVDLLDAAPSLGRSDDSKGKRETNRDIVAVQNGAAAGWTFHPLDGGIGAESLIGLLKAAQAYPGSDPSVDPPADAASLGQIE